MTIAEAIGLALQHHGAGRLAEAESIYRQILSVHRQEENSLHLLGVIAHSRGQLQDAADLIGRAIAVNPGVGEFHNNLALVLTAQGKYEEAAAECRRALELKPDSPEVHNNFGNALRSQGRLEEAIAAYRTALRYRPAYVEAHNNLGVVLRSCKRMDEAIAACRTALQLNPYFAEAYINLGTALKDHGEMDAALIAYQKAVQIKPDLAEGYNNIGDVLADSGQIDGAIAAFDRAIALKPDYVEAKFNCSLSLLLLGNFARGWPLYEARWAMVDKKPNFSQPMWDGRIVDGLSLLVHAEQGMGDSIQFIRYAKLAAARGAKVISECPQTLVELFRKVDGVAEIVTTGDPLPPFDLHVPMLSQPLVFQTRRETIPGDVPYLFADPIRCESWQRRFGQDRAGLRVGLAWAGNLEHSRTRWRNISLEMLLPLLAMEGVNFYSLQIGSGAEQLQQFTGAETIIDYTTYINDFADTAAFMMGLDLVISVDTAVAHLAGALGRVVWTLLPFVPDWRWGLEGDQTPWYPTMRLFRQRAAGEWSPVVGRVVNALTEWDK